MRGEGQLNKYVVVWDNVRFHHSHLVRELFAAHDRMLVEYLTTYSPFLNPIEISLPVGGRFMPGVYIGKWPC